MGGNQMDPLREEVREIKEVVKRIDSAIRGDMKSPGLAGKVDNLEKHRAAATRLFWIIGTSVAAIITTKLKQLIGY